MRLGRLCGWIRICNADMFKKAAFLLKCRLAIMTFQWVIGNAGTPGHTESIRLAVEGENKHILDQLDLSIPTNFDIQGAKLTSISQVIAY